MSAHLVEYAASARDLSLFHCDVVVHSCACSAYCIDPCLDTVHGEFVYTHVVYSPYCTCMHAEPILAPCSDMHTYNCVHHLCVSQHTDGVHTIDLMH